MLALLDSSKKQFDLAHSELEGFKIGQLLTPLTQYRSYGTTFAIDNGAYSKFQMGNFLGLIEREKDNKDKCLFITMPDIVGNARRTLESFDIWSEKLCAWPRALVLQEGIDDLDIPWRKISAIFIGGGNAFKTSKAVRDIVKCAKLLGKWTHMGRVNGKDRIIDAHEMGIDSIDGSGISRFSQRRLSISQSLKAHLEKK